MIAEKKFRRLNPPHLLDCVYGGTKFVDGVAVTAVSRELAGFLWGAMTDQVA